MALVAGVDGCPGGWLCITRDGESGMIGSEVYPDPESLMNQQPRPVFLAVDMPIGLVESCWRACDREARRLLGAPRMNSVFSAPIRPALDSATQDEASDRTQRVDGRRVSA